MLVVKLMGLNSDITFGHETFGMRAMKVLLRALFNLLVLKKSWNISFKEFNGEAIGLWSFVSSSLIYSSEMFDCLCLYLSVCHQTSSPRVNDFEKKSLRFLAMNILWKQVEFSFPSNSHIFLHLWLHILASERGYKLTLS